MQLIRFYFCKKGEAAYFSHLDLQRVMARALRRSGMPVWYSQGFNPHIYMTFALPLPLLQESECETMDCKTEAEQVDFASFLPALNAALPRGIEVRAVGLPRFSAADIATAEYHMAWPPLYATQMADALDAYNALPEVLVLRRTKRSEQQLDLKQYLPALQADETGRAFTVCLPAGGSMNLNPALLAGFLEQHGGPPAAAATILRRQIYTQSGQVFA